MSDFKGIKAKDVNAYNLDQRFGDNTKKFLELHEKNEFQKYSHINLCSIIGFLTVNDTVKIIHGNNSHITRIYF